MRKKSLRCWLVYLKSCQSYTLPLTLQQQQLRSQHPLAPVPEGSSASLIISASLIAPLSIFLYIPPPTVYSPPPFISALACSSLIPQFICIVFHRSPYTLVWVPLWQTTPAVVLRTFQEANDLAPFASVKGMQLFQTHEGDVVLWGIDNRQAWCRDLCVKFSLVVTVERRICSVNNHAHVSVRDYFPIMTMYISLYIALHMCSRKLQQIISCEHFL